MDLARIRELLSIVAQSGVAEVEIEEDDFKLVVRKNASTVMVQAPPGYGPPYGFNYAPPVYPPPAGSYPQAPPPAYVPPPPPQASPPGPASAPEPAPKEAAPAPAATDLVVRAPIVGTFYEAPAPDADPFVQVGDRVKPGDLLCIIEAMKLMNEIESEVAGTVKQVLVKNAEPVEYDQPLFVVEPA